MRTYQEYLIRKAQLASINKDPSKADQSGAEDTDINVIVKRYGVYGTIPQSNKTAKFGEDFSELPDDLRGMIETARSLSFHQGELPVALQVLTVEDLMTYDAKALAELLKPKQETKEEVKQ
nr:MAG: internal scaffolding protein [Microvirus sp.]